MQRLLNEEQILEQRCQRGIGAQRGVEVAEGGQFVELLVAIQRGVESARAVGGDDAGDLAQARQIQLRLAADLDLKVAQAIGADGFLQRVGQAIVQCAIGGAEGISQAHGMACMDARQRRWGNDIAHTHAA